MKALETEDLELMPEMSSRTDVSCSMVLLLEQFVHAYYPFVKTSPHHLSAVPHFEPSQR